MKKIRYDKIILGECSIEKEMIERKGKPRSTYNVPRKGIQEVKKEEKSKE